MKELFYPVGFSGFLLCFAYDKSLDLNKILPEKETKCKIRS
jgi:hypothetical protein